MESEVVHESKNYVWGNHELGLGAAGVVFKGMHKTTGQSVAIKVFQFNTSVPADLMQTRELDILKNLDHENIIKLLAVEEQIKTKKTILVTELCNGESLQHIINKTENFYGLCETEFLQVLHDISAGMKYLRSNNLIHRDIKPGNIVKFISADGKSTYKLIDFGTARVLKDDEQFMSLWGTYNYLCPAMFGRAALNEPTNLFPATVDLWSIGITIYKLATGMFPFRTIEETHIPPTLLLFIMMSQKPPGAISGMQCSATAVSYSNVLPKTCLLNKTLRKLVENLLRGILENEDKIWSYNQFFDCINDIVSRKTIHIFSMNLGTEISLLMPPHQTLKDMKEEIAVQLDSPEVNQLLLFDNQIFDSLIESSTEINTYPQTSCDQPILLMNNDADQLWANGCDSYEIISFPSFGSTNDLRSSFCAAAHVYARFAKKCNRLRELFLSATGVFMNLISKDVTKLSFDYDVLMQTVESFDYQFKLLEKSSPVIANFLTSCLRDYSFEEKQLYLRNFMFKMHPLKKKIISEASSMSAVVNTLKERVLSPGILWQEYFEAKNKCSKLDRCAEKADILVNEMEDNWELRVGSTNSERKNMMKVGIQRVMKTVEKFDTFKTLCRTSYLEPFEKLSSCYAKMQSTMVLCKFMNKEIAALTTVANAYLNTIDQFFRVNINLDEISAEGALLNSQLESFEILDSSAESEMESFMVLNTLVQNGQAENCSSNSNVEILDKVKALDGVQTDLRKLLIENDTLIQKLNDVIEFYVSGVQEMVTEYGSLKLVKEMKN